MRIVGMMRVRNEARWIKRSIESIMPLCCPVIVFDDHSDDETPEIVAAMWETVLIRSPFYGLNETRDKNWLLQYIIDSYNPQWIIAIDGDEQLTAESVPLIRDALYTPMRCMSFKVRYLWDREDQVRVDRVYGQFARQSMFRPGKERFTGVAPGFHTGNVPMALWGSCCYPGASLLHYGYLHKEDRIRKYRWYNEQDPNNEVEGKYMHMVQGDLPEIPACAVLQHAGPLALRPLSEVLRG